MSARTDFPQRDEDIRAAVIALEEHALELWNNGDPDGFLDLSSEDVVYTDPAFPNKLKGKTALKQYYDTIRGKVKIDSYKMIEPVVQIFSGTAILIYDYEAHREGRVFRMHCTEVYRLAAADSWQITHTHWSFAGSE